MKEAGYDWERSSGKDTKAGMYKFLDIYNLAEVRRLTEATAKALEIGIRIVDSDGNVITGAGCFCSEPTAAEGLTSAEVRIEAGGRYLASCIIGQVILDGEEIDEARQRERARLAGAEEDSFLKEIKNLPRKSRRQFDNIVELVSVMAEQLSKLGMIGCRQKEELAYQLKLEEELREEKRYLENYNKYDELTGVYSRSYFKEQFDMLCQKEAYPIALISGDMNNLKLMNDVFGHQYGDLMLTKLGEILRTEAKPSYLIGRCGGDEFCIAIPSAGEGEAEAYCNRVSEACQNTKECMVSPDIALGCQLIASVNEEAKEVFRRADEIMYSTKIQMKQRKNLNKDILAVLFRRGYLSKAQVEDSVERISRFAEFLQLDRYETDMLKCSARIQDIGLIAFPEELVKKQGQRTPQEKAELEKHTEIGYRLAKLYEESIPVAKIILQSHECWYGLGYPNHLEENEILYEARVLYMVTTYSRWIFGAPDGDGKEVKEARACLKEQAGKLFDPFLAEQFLEYLEKCEPTE